MASLLVYLYPAQLATFISTRGVVMDITAWREFLTKLIKLLLGRFLNIRAIHSYGAYFTVL